LILRRIAISIFTAGILSCSIQPSRKYGVDSKFVIDSIEVVPVRYSGTVYVLREGALPELDSLISPMYEGTENGRHYFINWSKISYAPFTVNHFALDTTLCVVDVPLSRSDENHRTVSESKPLFRETKFEKGGCSVSEPKRVGHTRAVGVISGLYATRKRRPSAS
jgi:hypothetical protein